MILKENDKEKEETKWWCLYPTIDNHTNYNEFTLVFGVKIEDFMIVAV